MMKTIHEDGLKLLNMSDFYDQVSYHYTYKDTYT